MERINLNIPEDARKRLRRIAKRSDKTESELARELLVGALDQAERDEFYRRTIEAQTPEVVQRHLEVLAAFEALGD